MTQNACHALSSQQNILGPGSVIAIIGFCLNGGLNVAGVGVMAS